MPHEHEPQVLDDSLFVLAMPEALAGRLDLPEPPELAHRNRGRRARIKRSFWGPLMKPQGFRPDFTLDPFTIRVFDDDHLDELENWAGLYQEPYVQEQPLAVEEALYENVPQFILRNLDRVEKDAWPDDLWWEYKEVRDLPHELGLDEIRTMSFVERPELLESFNQADLDDFQRQHQELFWHTDWSELRFRGGRKVEPPPSKPTEGRPSNAV